MESATGAGAQPGTQRGVLDMVRERANEQLSSQKVRATDGLGNLANAVRQTTKPLRDQQQGAIADYVEQAADKIEQFSASLRDRDLGDLLEDAQQFARRQPTLFIAATFTAGVLAARFLKSSAPDRAPRGDRFSEAGRTRSSYSYGGR
jgi:hypothetical protein